MNFLSSVILHYFKKFGWLIKAYVVLPNYYHILVVSPSQNILLSNIIKNIHKYTTHEINKLEYQEVSQFQNVVKRKICRNYWDSCITYESSHFARINYIHFNPVKHGYVDDPKNWNFSSYQEFYELNPSEIERIEREYPFNRVSVKDDF